MPDKEIYLDSEKLTKDVSDNLAENFNLVADTIPEGVHTSAIMTIGPPWSDVLIGLATYVTVSGESVGSVVNDFLGRYAVDEMPEALRQAVLGEVLKGVDPGVVVDDKLVKKDSATIFQFPTPKGVQ